MTKIIRFILLITITFLQAACQGHTESIESPSDEMTEESLVQTDTTTHYLPKNFESFWTEFRNAILDTDTNYLKKHTRFPLNVWGNLDMSPKYSIGEDLFNDIFTLFLNTNHSVNKDEIIKTVDANELPRYNPSATDQYVSDLYFEWINNEWKLTVLYMDTEKDSVKLLMALM